MPLADVFTPEHAAALYESGDDEGARRACDALLAASPADPDLLHLRAKAVYRLGDAAGALAGIEAAIAADPARAVFHLNRGRVLRAAGRRDEAAASFRRVVAIDAAHPGVWSDLGWTLREMDDPAGAVAAFEAWVAREPESVDAHLQLFAARYRAGDFAGAWPEYEWRLAANPDAEVLELPFWEGEPLEGRTVLLRAEQGMGDQIHFVRYAAFVKERGGRVVVRCHPALVRLLRTCPGVDEVVPSNAEALPPCDFQVWSGSLPRIAGTTAETIPGETPYLSADRAQAVRWRKLLAKFPEVKVGINWEGNRANVAGRNRAIPIEAFFPLAALKGVRLFSLQKGEGLSELDKVPPELKIPNLGQFFGDLYETAAAMEALDLVITNDTSLAHLAGALGRPVWIVLPTDCCWRWLDGREDTPWYPTARLFRVSPGDTLDDVAARLRDAASALPEAAARVDAPVRRSA
jgi:tetratricopeptide (TPR) repeat protein